MSCQNIFNKLKNNKNKLLINLYNILILPIEKLKLAILNCIESVMI